MKKYGKIAVLAGGISNEREISLKSGKAVYEALKKRKEDAELVDIKSAFRKELKRLEHEIVFIALHGKFGEDGTIQAMLEDLNIAYTGSGVLASRLAMDKLASKKLFLKNGLRVPAYKTIRKKDKEADIFKEFEIPFVLKPRCGGSSIGLAIVTDRARAGSDLEKAFLEGDTVIIEEYIAGRELAVGILGDEPLPVIEIATKHNVYDFSAKYRDMETKYILPAELKKSDYEKAQGAGLKAYKALGCRDFSRVDMRMDKDGNIYVLEVNTIPGLMERSLLPKAASAAGISFENLCMKIIGFADRRKLAHG